MRVGIDGVLFRKLQVDALMKIDEVDLVVNNNQSLLDEALGRSRISETIKIFEHSVKYSG